MSDDSDFLLMCSEEVDAVADLKLAQSLPPTPRCTIAATDDTTISFGKYKGTALKMVPADYLIWWLGTKPDYALDIKAYCIAKLKELENEARYTKDKFERARERHDRDSRTCWDRFRDDESTLDDDDADSDWGDRDDF